MNHSHFVFDFYMQDFVCFEITCFFYCFVFNQHIFVEKLLMKELFRFHICLYIYYKTSLNNSFDLGQDKFERPDDAQEQTTNLKNNKCCSRQKCGR
jgi:hypothetical protein